MNDENLDDENFDKPDPKAKLEDKKEDDFFKDDVDDDLEDLEVEIEDEKSTSKDSSEKKSHSEEDRFGKRRPRNNRPRDAKIIRDLQSELNRERVRNDRIEQRIDAVEANTSRIDDSTIDAQINEANEYLQRAKTTHAKAVKDGDGDTAADALDVMLEAKETITALKHQKDNRRVPERTEIKNNDNRVLPDPVVIEKFNEWAEENDWYDRTLKDKNSRIAFHIDNAMHAEGYDPRSRKYWEEFDKRLRENPTLAKNVFNDDSTEQDDRKYDDMDESEQRRPLNNKPIRRESSSLNDRNSNSNGQRKKIVVSKARADAMREMGLQPGTSEWKKMAKKYESYDKQHGAA